MQIYKRHIHSKCVLHSQLRGADAYYLQLYTQTMDCALYTFITTKEQYILQKFIKAILSHMTLNRRLSVNYRIYHTTM